jgi:quercetin dioxygenase-like cupin family protein
MAIRMPELQAFLDAARAALGTRDGDAQAVIDGVFARLAQPAPRADVAPARLPAVAQLVPALAIARGTGAVMAGLADRFAALEPSLTWRRSARTAGHGAAFDEGYASAIVVGADGLECRDDVRIGISLMAPGLQFPDHDHPPAEIYLVLSGGEWRQEQRAWWAPGSGGIVHNPPNITHAMRTTDTPLLAIWFLLM